LEDAPFLLAEPPMKKRTRVSYKRRYIRIERRFIVAKPYDTGFSWTLAAVLGEIILKAEEMFGDRDRSYTLLGIDFAPDPLGASRTWTPGNCKHIIVQLSMDCLTDRYQAYLNLAHEGVHLISPTGKADANVLEEGLAVYFSRWYMNDVFGDGWWNGRLKKDAYGQAFDAVTELLQYDENIIKKLRHVQPTIAYITAEQIQAHCPAAPKELAAFLASRFSFTPEG